MKFELANVSRWYNTPLSVVVTSGESDAPYHLVHSGLNLTPGGEWIAAPGLDPDPTVENLRQTIAGLSMQVNDLRERHDAGRDFLYEASIFLSDHEGHDSTTMASIKDIYDRCRRDAHEGKLPREQPAAPRVETDSADDLSFKLGYVERERDEANADVVKHSRRLHAIQEWATQPSYNPLLRAAQAYVLRLVKGES